MTTVEVAAGALVIALALGLLVALLRVSAVKPLRWLGLVYTDIIRGTPALAQLFIIYFGLSDIGIEFDPITAAVVGLGMNGAAYVGEIYRAGIQAIGRGQIEAALSLGMTPARTMRFIVLPQAVRLMLPPLTNYAISLVKDTAIISAIAAPEIAFEARRLVQETFLSNQVYLLAALIYLAITIPMSRLAKRLERRREAWH
ncbi:MAG: amino acid ABC transporter permease [Rhodospirillaceae bacterium]|nr:amino acid ABC transporter permease [Rhodospirillaceae bacterium]